MFLYKRWLTISEMLITYFLFPAFANDMLWRYRGSTFCVVQKCPISSFFASFIMMRAHFLVSFHGSRHPSITGDFHLPSLESESVFQGQPQKDAKCHSCGKHWRHWVFPNEAYRPVTQYGLWADAWVYTAVGFNPNNSCASVNIETF